MSNQTWTVTFELSRSQGDAPPRFERFTVEISPDEYVLDGVERIWALHDRSLVFRHACHHATCGACGMRVDGVEKLTCITRIGDVTHDGGTIRVAPLRNFPPIADLAVDLGPLYRSMEQVEFHSVAPLGADEPGLDGEYLRLADCIECGLCVSACPVAAGDEAYVGPAPLAAAQREGATGLAERLSLADSADGVWRCHSTFECAAVCPSFVEPARRLMELRRELVAHRVRRFFGAGKGAGQ